MKNKSMLRTLVALVCAFACTFTCVIPALATSDIVDSGALGTNLHWRLDTSGTLTISGQGEMVGYITEDYSYLSVFATGGFIANNSQNVPWYNVRNQIKSVIIEEGVTSIGDLVFGYQAACKNLVDVKIPNTVTRIGKGAFWQSGLQKINITESVTIIDQYAFARCGLTDITIPKGVRTIGRGAFAYCKIDHISLPDSVISIEEGAFAASTCNITVSPSNPAYTDIGGVLYSKDMTRLLHRAASFIDDAKTANAVQSYVVPDSVTTIDDGAFGENQTLVQVGIPASVIYMGGAIFYCCYSLNDVYYGGTEKQWCGIKTWYDKDRKMWYYCSFLSPIIRSDTNVHFNSTLPLTILVNDQPVDFGSDQPFIDKNGRTMVPLRAVGNALGLTVDWDNQNREAIFTNGQKTICFPIDSSTARTSDGETIEMDTAAVIVNNRTYAPVRYLAEYFGFTVGWDGSSKTITIK